MIEHQIKLEDIYDHNINLLIGSGASYGLFPTLSLNINNIDKPHTIETLGTCIEQSDSSFKPKLTALLFMHYYKTCIKPISEFDLKIVKPVGKEVIGNYTIFLNTLISILEKKRTSDKRCNLFTTNYDGCIPFIADEILKKSNREFVINDGTRGFRTKCLQAKYFNSYLRQTGVFSFQYCDLPQINLINLHGSAYWAKDGENIIVDYNKPLNTNIEIEDSIVDGFSALLNSNSSSFSDLETYAKHLHPSFDELAKTFLKIYNLLPIVNPTKWKFYETVFEEQYYQMLRAMSYELEKPNSIFISFGFSFADEHILNLVKRSLSNPSLQLYVCCFNADEIEIMKQKFIGHENVQFITSDKGNLNFKTFNDFTFSLNPIASIET